VGLALFSGAEVERHVHVLDVPIADLERRRLAAEGDETGAAIQSGGFWVVDICGENESLEARHFDGAIDERSQ